MTPADLITKNDCLMSIAFEGIKYTALNDNETMIGSNDSGDSRAVAGSFNPFLNFPLKVSISGKEKLVTTISECAFRKCKTIRTVRIHRYIKEIRNYCFDFCSNLYKITFDPNSNLEVLGYSAFYNGCYTSVVIPKSVKTFNPNIFGYNSKLKSLTYLGTTSPASTMQLFLNGNVPSKIYVGFDYPSDTFHDIPVTRINNLFVKCSCSFKKSRILLHILLFSVSVS